MASFKSRGQVLQVEYQRQTLQKNIYFKKRFFSGIHYNTYLYYGRAPMIYVAKFIQGLIKDHNQSVVLGHAMFIAALNLKRNFC